VSDLLFGRPSGGLNGRDFALCVVLLSIVSLGDTVGAVSITQAQLTVRAAARASDAGTDSISRPTRKRRNDSATALWSDYLDACKFERSVEQLMLG
jgi:hypothetical protein